MQDLLVEHLVDLGVADHLVLAFDLAGHDVLLGHLEEDLHLLLQRPAEHFVSDQGGPDADPA